MGEPSIFVKMAIENSHPRELLQCIPDNLEETLECITRSDDVSMARFRTAEARKWMLKAKSFLKKKKP